MTTEQTATPAPGRTRRNKPGAGRPPVTPGERAETISITLSAADLDTLRSIDANASRAIRILLARVRQERDAARHAMQPAD